jgi:malate dehydrogenase
MATVAIIGAGDLGGATAQALAARDCVGRIVLVDPAPAAAAGKALDIQQSGAILGVHTVLTGTGDLDRAVGCAVCIVADRFGGNQAEWQGDEGLSLLARLTPNLADTPIVFAGVNQAELLSRAARELHLPRTRLIGSCPEAMAASVTAILAMEAGCSPGEIGLAILGAPPDGFVVPWSEAAIGGYALDRVLDQVQLARIEARTARLWPPGPYTLGAAAAHVAAAVLTSARRSASVLTALEGEFGVRGRVGALPVRLGATGIVHARVPVLNPRERVRLETALGA